MVFKLPPRFLLLLHCHVVTLLLMSSLSFTANATLLGRINAYYNDQKAIPTDLPSLLAKKAYLNAEIARLEKEQSPEKNTALLKSANGELGQVEDLIKKFDSVEKAKEDLSRKHKESASNPKSDDAAAALAKAEAEFVKAKAELDKAINIADSKLVLDETKNGVKEGFGSATFVSGFGANANTAIAINAYRYNILFGKKGGTSEECKHGKCTRVAKYHSFPLYIFLKKTTDSKVDKTTVSNDLLDNELGGTIHLKLSGGWKRSLWRAFDFSKAEDPKLRQYGFKLILDGGIKLIEAPAVTTPDTTAAAAKTSWVSAGYVGVGANFEFPIFSPTNSSIDHRQNIIPGTKPAGGLAIGFGIYRNNVSSGQIDQSQFSESIPDLYTTYALMYELQITELLSVKGTRVIPLEASPLGTYTSFQIGYKF